MKERKFQGEDLYGNKVEYTVVATFDLNKRKYIFYTDMKNMFAGYYETKKVKNITNIEEYNLLMSVYNQLKVNSFKHEFFDYGYTFFEGKNYKIIYDKLEKKRFFFELIDNRYKEVEGKIRELLDDKFNVELLILNSNKFDINNESNKSTKNKRIINIAINDTIIPLILFTTIPVYNAVLTLNAINEKEINLDASFENIDLINNTIKENSKLEKEEKALLLSLEEIYNDNLEYLDSDSVINNLSNLDIKYKNLNNGNISGQYNLATNEITFFNINDISAKNLELILHEYFHALSNGGIANGFSDGLAISEGITEMLAVEYSTAITNNKVQGTYSKQQVYVSMLAEIINPDIIKKAYFQNNLDLLINAIANYSSEKEAYLLLATINDELIYEQEIGASAYTNDINDKNKNYKNAQSKIDNIFKKIFENKFGYPIENDKLMCSYLDQIRKGNRAEYEYYKEGNTFYSEVTKYYFNDRLKSNIALVEYYFQPGIAIKANKEDFRLLPDGKYSYKSDWNEELIFDSIQEYVLKTKMQTYIMENNRVKNTSKNK